jgi:tRNA1(Val) A37 N6-methylase TrmN6
MTNYDKKEISLDYFYKNRVKIFQKKRGYRFSVDSPILANFIPHSESDGLEIGSGSGIISLLLLYKKKFPFITGIEIQEDLFKLSEMSISANSFQSFFKVINDDFNIIFSDFKGIMNIFSNPPYLKIGIGHLSKNEEMKRGKFEIDIDLEQIVKKCSSILGRRGNLFLILPYDRFDELSDLSSKWGLFPVKFRKVLSFTDGKAERFLIQLSNYKGDPIELSPLVIYHSVGIYSEEMKDILAGR